MSNKQISLAIVGASGKMGEALRATYQTTSQNSGEASNPELVLKGVISTQPQIEGDVTPSFQQLPKSGIDVVIDFTRPEGTLKHLECCVESGAAMVIGTTGFSDAELDLITRAAETIPIVLASNMSVGVNLCFYLLEKAAKVMGDDADIEIMETHHRNKIDAPSGTALSMGRIIASSLGRNFDEVAKLSREGLDEPRERQTIGFASTRAGDVVGDHTVLFAGTGERVEITHKASDRSIYAQGAFRAARWIVGKKPALYDMQDVLNLRD